MDRSLLNKLTSEVRRYHNKDFLKATMAVCALSARADNEAGLSERFGIDHVMANVPALRVFDVDKTREILGGYFTALREDEKNAKKILSNKVRRMGGNHKRARTLMRVAFLIIVADENIHYKERLEFARLCLLLDLEPGQVWNELEAT
jgi:tellurite resistance protein TerB